MGGVLSLSSNSVQTGAAVYDKDQLLRLWTTINGASKGEFGTISARGFDPLTFPASFFVLGFTVLLGLFLGVFLLRGPRSGSKNVESKGKSVKV